MIYFQLDTILKITVELSNLIEKPSSSQIWQQTCRQQY